MDSLIFMLIASGAATFLLFVSSLYVTSTNSQLTTIYNYEYAGNAMIAMHYAKDDGGAWFWNELKSKFSSADPDEVQSDVSHYLESGAKSVWKNISYSSPAGANTILCFEGVGVGFCCGDTEHPDHVSCGDVVPAYFQNMTIYTYSTKVSSDITAMLKLYY